jgi:hypothetical protein
LSTPLEGVILSHSVQFRRLLSDYDFTDKDTKYSIRRKLEDAGLERVSISTGFNSIENGYLIVDGNISVQMPKDKKEVAVPKKRGKAAAEVVEETTEEDEDDEFTVTMRQHHYMSGFSLTPINAENAVDVGTINAILNALSNDGIEVEYVKTATAAAPQAAPATNVAFQDAPVPQAPVNNGGPLCADCGQPITFYMSSKGKPMPVELQVKLTTNQYQKQLCKTCNGKRFAQSRAS